MKNVLLIVGLMLWAVPASAQTNITIPASLTCSDGFAIVFASGVPTCAATSGVGTVTNTSFTTGTIPKASGGAALVDSIITESGSVITVTGTMNATTAFTVNGTALASTHLSDTASIVRTTAANTLSNADAITLSVASGSTPVTISNNPIDVNPNGAAVSGFINFLRGASWDAIGYPASTSALAIGGYRSSQWDTVQFYANGALAGYISSGLVIGSPTGGDKGAGTINATAVYDDNVLLSDWVFEEAYDQQQRKRNDPPDKVKGPNRKLSSLSETKAVTQREKRLPWMPKADEFEVERNIGGMMTRLWVGQEQQMLYIFDLESRIAALEKGKK